MSDDYQFVDDAPCKTANETLCETLEEQWAEQDFEIIEKVDGGWRAWKSRAAFIEAQKKSS